MSYCNIITGYIAGWGSDSGDTISTPFKPLVIFVYVESIYLYSGTCYATKYDNNYTYVTCHPSNKTLITDVSDYKLASVKIGESSITLAKDTTRTGLYYAIFG